MSKESTRPDPTPVSDAKPATSNEAVDREKTLTSIHDEQARVRVRVPASWIERGSSFVLVPDGGASVAGIQFTIICDKECTADDIARFPTIIDTAFDNKARPNQNSGDPALDAVRLDVAVVEEGELTDGRFRVARVTKGPTVRGPIRDQLFAVCVRGRPGSKIVSAQGWVELAREKELGKLVTDACKTFEILP